MQRIVDRSEATAERKRCPQMVAILIEISITPDYAALNCMVGLAGKARDRANAGPEYATPPQNAARRGTMKGCRVIDHFFIRAAPAFQALPTFAPVV